MMEKIPDRNSDIQTYDICGLWEVIRIFSEIGNETLYPWVGERFKYNFLPEKIFLCFKDGQHTHGTWELSEKTCNNQKQFSIILNGNFKFKIVDIDAY